ncbi:Crp/Fnr family transcriptional regulator [Listeria ivanovii]|uniref:Crp/Fnr family transcriptional regulator n=2 Tax=Listeria ivanovii TaxID=1638 RepID=Q6R6D2_LISIV|nr:Crp/Fnr family transcriptional regulator [Listeria ivanovii]AAR97350.1 PrfA [Listeria ivanovii subsp. londoniensis]AIS58665.1 Listeriolysin regulatory protein [Listeria ivanovii subsp. londoniensis]AIS61471.1 Listeriolysin regulatory protein [Listeria ivanovii subsp. londoniensis]MBK1962836.1 Crp/Fnr family transcriptional regulator [Listeria ivanovii subsp. londoniensis]MBK1967463.1 Crp/Fnr family transcriptional regulator [Listeria ivanovii subsp. londoniensis]
MDAQAADFQNLLETNGIKPKKFKKKDIIFNQWDPQEYCVFLYDGIAKLTNISENGSIMNLQYYKGAFIIMSGSLDTGKPLGYYNLEVISKTATAYVLKISDLKNLVSSDITQLFYITQALQKQVSYSLAKFNDFSANGKLGSICGQLLILTYVYGEKTSDGIKIALDNLTMQELGYSSGIAHCSAVSRILSKLKKEKVIEYKNSSFYVQNLDYLKKIAPKLDEWFYLACPSSWEKFN